MKASVSVFRDQVTNLTEWFEGWNDCERTVTLVALIKQMGPLQARLLTHVLECMVAEANELPLMEQRANNPTFVSSLNEESPEIAIIQLLQHLPLLCPGNEEAKAQYLKIIPKVLTHALSTGTYMEEGSQLLSYSMIHPALCEGDRYSFNLWLHHLQQKMNNGCGTTNTEAPISENVSTYVNEQSYGKQTQRSELSQQLTALSQFDCWKNYIMPPSGNDAGMISQQQPVGTATNGCRDLQQQHAPKNGQLSFPFASSRATNQVSYYQQQMNGGGLGPSTLNGNQNSSMSTSPNQGGCFQARVRRSNSLTPPTSGFNGSTTNSQGPLVDDMPMYCKQRSMSLSSEHAPLSPQSSVASSGSGSESHLDEPRSSFNSEGSGMKDVPSWLKTLRLHKYAPLFANMTYDEMMSLSEDKLENVTKGARHKIILSIQKLKERQETLRLLEKSIIEGGSIRNALNELRSILSTPLKQQQQTSTSNETDASNGCGLGDSDSSQAVPEGDLLGQFTKVVGKVCTQLLVGRPDDENFSQFLLLVDKCVAHECFSEVQKKRFLSWRHEVQNVWHTLPPRRGSDVRHNRGRWNGCQNGSSNGGGYLDYGSVIGCGDGIPNLTRRRVSGPFVLQGSNNSSSNITQSNFLAMQLMSQRHLSPKHSDMTPMEQFSQHRALQSLYSKRPSLQDQIKCHGSLTRTKSAPVRPQFGKYQSEQDPEINVRLESLCLSVTEHALGSLG